MRDKSQRIVSEFPLRHPMDRHILIASATDTYALGTLEAVCVLERSKNVPIAGKDCTPQVLEEMQAPGRPLVGSVSRGVLTYRRGLIELGMALIRGHSVSPNNYVDHKVLSHAKFTAAIA